jgi:hypothetical protein
VVVLLFEPFFVGNAANEKFQFRRDKPERHFFCGQQGKTLCHIVFKHRPGDS